MKTFTKNFLSSTKRRTLKNTSFVNLLMECTYTTFFCLSFNMTFRTAMFLWAACSFAENEITQGDNAAGISLVEIQPGTFRMGARSKDKEMEKLDRRFWEDELPVHTVRISQRFWMGKYEVTQAQFKKLMGGNPSRFKAPRKPVENVSWSDAMNFCRELTKRERAAGRLPDGYVYRLPTEAEWEYSCRAGGENLFCFGDSEKELQEYAHYAIKSNNQNKGTNVVGAHTPNAWGLHDMHGNVWEWCYDWYDKDYYSKSPKVDPVNLEPASFWVFRGGGWFMNATGLRCANRYWYNTAYVNCSIGFRVCLAPQIR